MGVEIEGHYPNSPGVVLDAFDAYYAVRSQRPDLGLGALGAARLPDWAAKHLPAAPNRQAIRASAAAAGRAAGGRAIARAKTEVKKNLNRAEKELRAKFQAETGVAFPQNIPTTRAAALRQGKAAAFDELRARTGINIEEIPSSLKDLGTLGKAQAETLLRDELNKQGVPVDMLVSLKDFELSAEGVRDVAYAAAKTFGEEALKAEFGISIEFPDKFTAKAFVDSFASIIPADLESLIDTGIAIGTQLAASALTSLLVGAGVGSIVPGLGTVVGIAVALGVAGLRSLFAEEVQEPCKTKIPVNVPAPTPVKNGSIEQLALTQMHLVYVDSLITKERRGKTGKQRCSGGPIGEYAAYLSTISTKMAHVSEKTPQTLGAQQLDYLIPLYQRAIAMGPRSTYMVPFLGAMQRRRQYLTGFIQKGLRIKTMPMSEVADMRFAIVTEMRTAGVQLAYAPSDQTRGWFTALAMGYGAIVKREEAFAAERKATFIKHTARTAEIKADPGLKRKADLEILQFRCGQGDERACVEHRRLSKAPAAAVAPPTRRPPPPARPRADVAAAQLTLQCNAMLADWSKKNPIPAACLTPADAAQMVNLCREAFGPKTITLQTALARIQQISVAACARTARRVAPAPARRVAAPIRPTRRVAAPAATPQLSRREQYLRRRGGY